MIERQHVWLGPEATTFDEPCEACMALGAQLGLRPGSRSAVIHGTLRADADVGFMTCRRGHRIVARRLVRSLAAA